MECILECNFTFPIVDSRKQKGSAGSNSPDTETTCRLHFMIIKAIRPAKSPASSTTCRH